MGTELSRNTSICTASSPAAPWRADRSRWIAGRSSFLFPVRALSTVFRAKYLAGLQRAFDAGQLTFAGGTADLADRRAFTGFLGQLRAVDWVVYAKRPFAGPEQVLDYLGRYTHRVALSNDRLVDHRDGRVRFRWKDYADHDRVKVMTLDVDEFLRRFLLHVVPRGFMRIRHFGLLANRTRRGTVDAVPGTSSANPHPRTPGRNRSPVLLQRLTGVDLARCPVCGEGRMQITAIVVRVAPAAGYLMRPRPRVRRRRIADTRPVGRAVPRAFHRRDLHATARPPRPGRWPTSLRLTRRLPSLTLARPRSKVAPHHARAALQSP